MYRFNLDKYIYMCKSYRLLGGQQTVKYKHEPSMGWGLWHALVEILNLYN